MKELSIKAKAKAYDKVLSIAKNIYGASENKDILCTLETIFPQFQEPDDEKLREQVVYAINQLHGCACTKTKLLAWLEKQGEKPQGKSALEAIKKEKVEPKFKVGDWVVWDNKICCHIDNIYQGKESLMYSFTDAHNRTHSYSVKGFDNNAHLWTIQDAKDGDVLATLNHILIFEKVLPKDGGVSHCHYGFGSSTPQFNFNKDENWYFGKEAIIHPATKEQREQLEKAMADSGFTFDFEKKELKKIEQNSVWSEEDEEKFSFIRAILIDAKSPNNCASNSTYYREVTELIEWLKSLKDRVLPQSQQDWSEEDEEMRLDAIKYLEIFDAQGIHGDKAIPAINWLKSLRPQNTWKPSDEQMKALDNFIYAKYPNIEMYGAAVKSLYDDLMKLK